MNESIMRAVGFDKEVELLKKKITIYEKLSEIKYRKERRDT